MKALVAVITVIFSLTFVFLLALFIKSYSLPVSLRNFENENKSSELLQKVEDYTSKNGFPIDIIPNIVHYILFGRNYITFIHFISIISVQQNHNPEKIFIHCDCDAIEGEYWNRLNKSNILVKKMEKPKTIFGKQLAHVYHSSDIGRIKALMKYGGMYFDTDVFVFKPLNKYFKFEMSIGWPENQNLGNQVIIAHKNARFLRLWLESYKHYNGSIWYYNAGVLPTQSILVPNPHLVHRVKTQFGVECCTPCYWVFGANVAEDEWRNKYHTVHMFYRWRWEFVKNSPPEIYEKDVWSLKTTFGQMARSVLKN